MLNVLHVLPFNNKCKRTNKQTRINRIITDDNKDTFRELGGMDILMECLNKLKELSSGVIACLAKVVNENSNQ